MAWQDDMIIMLRVLVSDLSSTPTYSDGRLEQVLVVAGQYVNQELDFDNTYTVTISPPAFSPDPVGIGDDAFVNFTVLKAACLTDQSTFRTRAFAAGVKARCGPAVLDTMRHLDGFTTLLKMGPCAAYETLKNNWVFGNAELVRAVLSPFCGNGFDPANLAGGDSAGFNRTRDDTIVRI